MTISNQIICLILLGIVILEFVIMLMQKKRHTCGVLKFDISQPDHPVNILFYEPIENLESKNYIVLDIVTSKDSRK